MRSSSLLLAIPLAALFGACTPEGPREVIVHAPDDLPEGTRLAVADLVSGLSRMAGDVVPVSRSSALPGEACEPGVVRLVVLGHTHADATKGKGQDALAPQAYDVTDVRCDAFGRRIVLRGGSLLSAQWAVYDLMRALGVRFFHPEQTYFPAQLSFPDEDLSKEERPWFQRRILGVHRTHPVELSAPLEEDDTVDMAAHQKRWIDWNVKVRNNAVNGWDEEHVGDYAYVRGFPRESGFNLLNSQQGGRPILDPDDPRSEAEQLEEALEEAFAPAPGLPDITTFSFGFNPSEFTEADDELTVERLTFIADWMREHQPAVKLYTTNHGTHAEPTDDLGVRFFDLPEFAPPNLGVKVHTLMFYDLERPAPVYGNQDFSHMLAWARREAGRRRIIHFPESSWWLTFDLPVPLYLAPVTLEARQHDLDLLADLVADDEDAPAGVIGHRVFTSGQEWGYWLIDWCASHMTFDRDVTWTRCLADFTSTFEGGDALYEVLLLAAERQVDDMRDPALLAFLVGSDDETEIALQAGIHFHPLPPAPADVVGYSDEQVRALIEDSLEPLKEMAADYAAWAARVEELLPRQDEGRAPFVREVYDGLLMFGLRAEHAVKVYETALALREALAAGDLEAVSEAYAGVLEARALTEVARERVRAREADYRYPPALTLVGDEPGTSGAIPNKTIYPYRYLSRTHRMFYWERPDTQLAALFGEGIEVVRPSARVLEQSTPLEVTLLADDVSELRVDWGDGTVSTELAPHAYAEQGLLSWSLDVTTATGVVHHDDEVAVVERRVVFPKGRLDVEYPPGASALEGLLPGFVVGLGEDDAPFLALGRLDGTEPLAAKGSLLLRGRSDLVSGPEDLVVELKDVGQVNLYDAELTLTPGESAGDFTLRIQGDMRTGEVVDLLVSVGGFEEEGARGLIAALLDYTPETLPEEEVLILVAQGREGQD